MIFSVRTLAALFACAFFVNTAAAAAVCVYDSLLGWLCRPLEGGTYFPARVAELPFGVANIYYCDAGDVCQIDYPLVPTLLAVFSGVFFVVLLWFGFGKAGRTVNKN